MYALQLLKYKSDLENGEELMEATQVALNTVKSEMLK